MDPSSVSGEKRFHSPLNPASPQPVDVGNMSCRRRHDDHSLSGKIAAFLVGILASGLAHRAGLDGSSRRPLRTALYRVRSANAESPLLRRRSATLTNLRPHKAFR
ncbi:hypothetical protein [Tahibacter sp.]|uniref:hypothetical protein n=1 Tax=Tahibacter sp. TaxID=2056211 RepID=UPI002D7ED07A|nr:hypothetical protein [Tahibacter sp.]